MVIIAITVTSFFYIGKNSKVSDTQILSGEIVQKERKHDDHQEYYECNCNEDGCDQCSRTVYTVDWYAVANIGKIHIDSASSYSSSIYNKSDTERYSKIVIGEPASIVCKFKNYIAARPDSVLHNRTVETQYEKIMPNYPGNVYDFYRINRVVMLGNVPINSKDWNDKLSNHMKKWGMQNKGNVILVFTDIKSRGFTQSLKNHWLQGKQNDVVIVFGIEANKIVWNDVFSWTENEIFKLELSDDLGKIKNIENQELVFETINKHMSKFKYRDMEKDFEYLSDSIEPHFIWMPIAYLVSLFLSFFVTTFTKKYYEK